MKRALIIILLITNWIHVFSQSDSILKFIFVPHPRSEDRIKQSVLPALEKINYSKFEMILLGGDITYYTSINRTTLDYCDRLFDLKNPNTLWSLGNHDIEDGNRALIKDYTGRESFYSYYRSGITFLVLDTELEANKFISTFISGAQLQLVKNVCDTISKSNYLVVLHSRLLWMVDNDDLNTKLDSVAQSTKQLDTTNFYQDVYPLLQKAKNNGVKVICLGGDKSKINIEYSPEENITFFAATMAPEYSDSENNVMIFSYHLQDKEITSQHVSLAKIGKEIGDNVFVKSFNEEQGLTIWQSKCANEINIQLRNSNGENAVVEFYATNGLLCLSVKLRPGEIKQVTLQNQGIYLVKATIGNFVQVKKIIIQ